MVSLISLQLSFFHALKLGSHAQLRFPSVRGYHVKGSPLLYPSTMNQSSAAASKLPLTELAAANQHFSPLPRWFIAFFLLLTTSLITNYQQPNDHQSQLHPWCCKPFPSAATIDGEANKVAAPPYQCWLSPVTTIRNFCKFYLTLVLPHPMPESNGRG